MTKPALSIVIPTHQTRELTLCCLASLAAAEDREGLGESEWIVVDDGSRDGTAEALAARHPKTEVVRNQSPRGFTRAANQGMARARGELLLLLNSDTEVRPGALTALLAAFAQDARLGVGGAHLFYPDGRPQWSAGELPGLLWFFSQASALPATLARLPGYRRLKPAGRNTSSGVVGWVTGAALAIRRPLWQEIGPFDETFRLYAQDLDLCHLVGKAGWKVALVPGFEVVHHHGATIQEHRSRQTIDRQHSALLWQDLLTWAAKHRGAGFAGRVRRALRWGSGLRLLARNCLRPWRSAAERQAYDRDTEALRAARREISPLP
ncbi:MAG: glycosyltransferase family 2 protein [Acidobacteriota bacterium]